VPIALAGTLIFSVATIPAFVIIEILLPLAQGFVMFALVTAPMIFVCAFLMAKKKTYLIGFFSALLFASAGVFQNRMAYDPIGLINTSIAAVVATAVAMVLWAIVAPATPQAARTRFARLARDALAGIGTPHRRIALVAFETEMTEALAQLQAHLRPDSPDDTAILESGITLFGAGSELIRLRDQGTWAPAAGWKRDIAELVPTGGAQSLDAAARQIAANAAARSLAALHQDAIGSEQAQVATSNIIAFDAIRDELERGSKLATGEGQKGVLSDVA
jgi:uncharacterized membrane protein YccC